MDTTRRNWLRYLFGAGAFTAIAPGCRRGASSSRRIPRRVVSLSPSTTEAVYAVGAGNLLVGRSTFCDYPPEVAKLPTVGGFVDTNLEAVLHLAPDLVVGARGPAGPSIAEKLESLGIATFFPKTQSIADIDTLLLELAKRLSMDAQGDQLVAAMRRRRAEIARAVSGERRIRTLLVFGLSPIVVAGPQSFPSEMLAVAGGDNVVTSGGAFPTLSAETLIQFDPDVIIDGASGASSDGTLFKTSAGWSALRAVREEHVAKLTDEAALRPGPRVGEGIATLARILHPNLTIP